jgi:hypothetical protein
METRCVPFKLVVEGQEIEAYLTEKNWELVLKAINKKKTGYERVPFGEIYWRDTNLGYVQRENDEQCDEDEDMYKVANYYYSKEVAENNSRADTLMRQLRRFAVEHRKNELDWNNYGQRKFYIGYDCANSVLDVECDTSYITSHTVYFDSYDSAEDAINAFSAELKWYFTEYKDSL